jgi:hypothetical protein
MTQWLEYFTEGLKTQMHEVKSKGEIAIILTIQLYFILVISIKWL